MRWIVTLIILAVVAWFFSNRRRRAQLQERVQDVTPPAMKEQAQSAMGAVTDLAAAAREKASDVPSQVTEKASQLGDAARNAVPAALDRARAGGAVGAAPNGQDTAGATAAEGVPSVQETVQTELSKIGEKVDALRSKAEAPPDTSEKSAGEAFGEGTLNATEMRTTAAPTALGDEAPAPATPEGLEGRPIAGEGTTTATGGTVDALSPTPQGTASTGSAAPLPEGLTAGEPGTGGPRGSSQAPSTPEGNAAPTSGMEQPPEIDRTADVLDRTSGAFIGNKKTRVFHAAGAGNLPGEDNRVYFESEDEAVAAGFRPAEREGLESAES